MTNKEAFIRLLDTKVRKYLNRLIFALFFSIIVAASTSATAWILDPAIKKIFVDKNLDMLFIIPIAIILAFSYRVKIGIVWWS